MRHVVATITKMRFVGSNKQVYYDNLRNESYANFQSRVLFKEGLPCSLNERSIAMVFNETTMYDFILPSKTCQRHLEARAANVLNLVQSFQKKLPLLIFLR